jgi:acyl-CoA synthetase (AMP-forming)/AMP-acid ligase II
MHIERPFPAPPRSGKRRLLRPYGGLRATTFLDAYAQVFGDRPVLFFDRPSTLPTAEPDRVTYRELLDLAARIGAFYDDLGLRPRDAVAFLSANRIELAVAALAALRRGFVTVPLSALLTPHEIDAALRRSDAKALVCDRRTARNLEDAGVAVKTVVLLEHATPGSRELSLPDAIRDEIRHAPPAPVDPDDPALLFFTSGTTGEPKGATIPHRAVGAVIDRQARVTASAPTPRNQLALLVMPLAHTGGFMTLVITLCLAVPCVVLTRFDPKGILSLIEEVRPTIFAGSPAMYRLLIEAGAEGYDLSSIRIWGGGADVFERELLAQLRSLGGWRRLGVKLKPFTVVGYGSSETAGQVTVSPPVPFGDRCIGWVLPGFKYKIRDEAGHDVSRGEPGELWLRGPGVMSGYWDDLDATHHAMPGGWFRTGDIVRQGRGRLLYYESRQKDVIKSGGYSIAAREIEEVLESHPAVSQAAAVGLPDPIKGERPVAAVVVREPVPVAELAAWAEERLAPYKRPRVITIVDEIPVTATFKPRKAEVREMLLRTLA